MSRQNETLECHLPPGEFKILQDNGLAGAAKRQRIPMSGINWRESDENKGRPQAPLNLENVEDFVQAIENGATFPDIVVNDTGDGRFVIWSGRHRAAAFKKTKTEEVSAVVIKCSDERLIDLLPGVFNTCCGERLNRKERAAMAYEACEKWKMSIKEASAIYSVPPGELSRIGNARKTSEKLDTLRVGNSSMTAAHLLALSPLKSNDNVLVAAAKLCNDAHLTAAETKEVVAAAKDGSESERVTAINELRRQYIGDKSWSKSPAQKRGRAVVANAQLTGILKTLNSITSARQLGITDKHEIEIFNGRLGELKAECTRVIAGKKRGKQGAA